LLFNPLVAALKDGGAEVVGFVVVAAACAPNENEDCDAVVVPTADIAPIPVDGNVLFAPKFNEGIAD
jgi:hypothetical protein